MKTNSDTFIFSLIAVILLVGTAAMYWLIYALPVSSGSVWAYVVYTVALIALGLAIPYWVLKLGMHSAHLNNTDEKEMNLSDIPKDKHDMARRN